MKKRPQSIPSTTIKVKVGCGSLYVTIGVVDNGIVEIFTVLGKSGGCPACFLKTLSMMIAVSIRGGTPMGDIIKHLIGQRCPSPSFDDSVQYLSCPDAIGQVLRDKQKELKDIDSIREE